MNVTISFGFLVMLSTNLFAGEYLALTGEKLKGEEMVACGVATHYSHSSVSSSIFWCSSFTVWLY